MKYEEIIEEAMEQFPCKVLDCDGEGTYDDYNGEINPCQYCHVYRFPIKDAITSTLTKRDEAIRKMIEGICGDYTNYTTMMKSNHLYGQEVVVKEVKERLLAKLSKE